MGRTNSGPKIKTIPWDSAAYLKTDEDIAHYLEAVFEDGDPSLVAAALGDVARARAWHKSRRRRALVARAFTRRFRPRETRNSPQC